MVDIHSHFLYGLDDGARTIEDSLAMLDLAASHGTTDIVATPHFNEEFEYRPEVIASQIKDLQAQLGDRIRLHAGCDLHLTYTNVQAALTDPSRYSVNGKGWLLVEFSELLIFNSSDQIFADLQGAGMAPIVTHPERNWLLRSKPERIERWVANGTFMQVTAQSLLAGFGSEAAKFSHMLMDRGLVHFIASDAHDVRGRSPRLDQAFEYVQKEYGEECAKALFVDNPKSVIQGLRVDRSPVTSRRSRRKKWFQFWR